MHTLATKSVEAIETAQVRATPLPDRGLKPRDYIRFKQPQMKAAAGVSRTSYDGAADTNTRQGREGGGAECEREASRSKSEIDVQ